MRDLVEQPPEDTPTPQRIASAWENPLWEHVPEEYWDDEAFPDDARWDDLAGDEK